MITEYFEHPLRERNSFHVEESVAHLVEFDDKADLDVLFAEGKTPENNHITDFIDEIDGKTGLLICTEEVIKSQRDTLTIQKAAE